MGQVDDPHHAEDHGKPEADQHQRRDGAERLQPDRERQIQSAQIFTSTTNCWLVFGSVCRSQTDCVSIGG